MCEIPLGRQQCPRRKPRQCTHHRRWRSRSPAIGETISQGHLLLACSAKTSTSRMCPGAQVRQWIVSGKKRSSTSTLSHLSLCSCFVLVRKWIARRMERWGSAPPSFVFVFVPFFVPVFVVVFVFVRKWVARRMERWGSTRPLVCLGADSQMQAVVGRLAARCQIQ